MNEHYFYNKIGITWSVRCSGTNGTFCTTVWDKGLFPQNICPCCKEKICKVIK